MLMKLRTVRTIAVTSNKAQFIDVLSRCLKTTNDNNEWCGYWQRKIIHQEVIWQ